MAHLDRDRLPGTLDTPSRAFVLWLLEALELRVDSDRDAPDRDARYEIVLPPSTDHNDPTLEHPHASLVGRQFTFENGAIQNGASENGVIQNGASENGAFENGAFENGGPSEPTSTVECISWQSPLMGALLDAVQGGSQPLHAAAAHQPLSVHELAEHLFAQYQVDGGHMHLAGCSLEDRPFLRLSYVQEGPDTGCPQLLHCYGTSDGALTDGPLEEALDLTDLVPVEGRAPTIEPDVVRRWTDLTRQQFEAQQSGNECTLVAVTLVWCKYAEGKLTFSIGQKTAEVPFSGWGRMFAQRRILPPPYECPLTGRTSYHLGATDDGRITVAEAIATCAASSRRVLENELQECAVSGSRALPEFMQECPCTGEQVLASLLKTCSWCQQQVSPRALSGSRCSACRQLKTVSKAEPALARILDTYPTLNRLRTWKMAETRAAQVLVGSSAWKRLLVVIDEQTLDVLHMAAGSRVSSKWVPVTDVQRSEWLG